MSREKTDMLRSAGLVGAFTVLSRILGYARTRVIAHILGTGFMADAFYAIFRIPNTFRRWMGEGALTAAVVPVFTELHEKAGGKEAWHLADRVFYALAFILSIIAGLGVLFSAQIISVTGFAASGSAQEIQEAIVLNRIIFPYVFFICLAALAMAFLNSAHVYGPSAFTPSLLNISLIASAFLLAPRFENPARGLALGVFIGGVLQLGFQLPFLWKYGMRFVPSLHIMDKNVRRVIKLFIPGALGAGMSQINILIGVLVATYLARGSVSSLFYANRVTELAYSVTAVGLSTVLLPTMSRQNVQGRVAEVKKTLAFSLRIILVSMVPASIGLTILRRPIVDVLFRGGAFGEESVTMTAFALLFYGAGVLAYSAVRILLPAFYSEQDTRTPVRVGMAVFSANLILMSLLVGPLGHGGIAFANVASAYLNAVLLLLIFVRRRGALPWTRLNDTLGRTLLAGTLMGATVWFSAQELGLFEPFSFVRGALRLFIVIALGIAVYVLVQFLLKAPEIKEIRNAIRRKTNAPDGN